MVFFRNRGQKTQTAFLSYNDKNVKTSSYEFIVDSGCIKHMIRDINVLDDTEFDKTQRLVAEKNEKMLAE